MPTPVLGRQRQPDQQPDRAVGAQHRLGQLEQRIRPRGEAVVELLAKSRQLPERAFAAVIMHTNPAALESNFLLSQEEASTKGCAHDQLGSAFASDHSLRVEQESRYAVDRQLTGRSVAARRPASTDRAFWSVESLLSMP